MKAHEAPAITLRHGVCECGHSGEWHQRDDDGSAWGQPCLIDLCACKRYDYSGRAVGHLIADAGVTDPHNMPVSHGGDNGRTES